MRIPHGLWFVAVGAAAAAVHLAVVTLLVEALAAAPLVANVAAFLVAFCVSYAGHSRLTFAHQGAATAQSLPRFFAVAVSAFALNELLYWIALQQLHWPYRPALFAVLVIVAAGTYVASRAWAFANKDPR